MYLGPKQTSMMEAFCENRLTAVNHFRKNFIINVWKGTTCVLPCIMKSAQLWITSAFYFHVQKKLCLYDYPDFGYKNLYRNATCEINICLKSVSNQHRRYWHRSGFFIVNFANISHIPLVFPLLLWAQE